MCRRVTCSSCGKPTFAGCGMHIEQVLGDVPRAERCRCHEAKSEPKEKGPKTSKAERAKAQAESAKGAGAGAPALASEPRSDDKTGSDGKAAPTSWWRSLFSR